MDALVSDGDGDDDDALLVSEFATAASEVIQEDAELASAHPAYTDARKRLAEKFRHRGFFPSSHSASKGMGRLWVERRVKPFMGWPPEESPESNSQQQVSSLWQTWSLESRMP